MICRQVILLTWATRTHQGRLPVKECGRRAGVGQQDRERAAPSVLFDQFIGKCYLAVYWV